MSNESQPSPGGKGATIAQSVAHERWYLRKILENAVQRNELTAAEIIDFAKQHVKRAPLDKTEKQRIREAAPKPLNREQVSSLLVNAFYGAMLGSMDRNHDGIVSLKESQDFFKKRHEGPSSVHPATLPHGTPPSKKR